MIAPYTKRRQSTVTLAPEDRARLQLVINRYSAVHRAARALRTNETTLMTARTGGMITPKAKARLLEAITRELCPST